MAPSHYAQAQGAHHETSCRRCDQGRDTESGKPGAADNEPGAGEHTDLASMTARHPAGMKPLGSMTAPPGRKCLRMWAP